MNNGNSDKQQKNTLMTENERLFIDFLISSKVLKFGKFVTKSGRSSPFFFNFGEICEGEEISTLGSVYAEAIIKHFGSGPFVIFGPAYKGIPLSVATVISLSQKGCEARYLFNRKEAKTHGDAGMLVGKPPIKGETIIIVDDVVTAGTTLREVVPLIRELLTDQSCAAARFGGVVIGVDREEKGEKKGTKVEVEELLQTAIYPIVSIGQIINYLSSPNSSGRVLTEDELAECHKYREIFGTS